MTSRPRPLVTKYFYREKFDTRPFNFSVSIRIRAYEAYEHVLMKHEHVLMKHIAEAWIVERSCDN